MTSNALNSPWTIATKAELTRLVELGWSSGQIAAAFGMTRNAIVGKCHRMGLQLGGGCATAPKAAPARKSEKRVNIAKAKAPKFIPVVIQQAQGPHRARPLSQLRPHECKWGLDDPGPGNMDQMLMCAAPTAPESPYCACHTAESTTKRWGRFSDKAINSIPRAA